MDILLDFDGTVVEHAYPAIGRCNFGCVEVIKKLQDAGHKVILNTMRCEFKDDSLKKALEWFDKAYMFLKDRDLAHSGNFDLQPITHTQFKHNPGVWDWEYFLGTGVVVIDDMTRGVPLKPAAMTKGMMVDWDEVDKQLRANGLY